MVYKLRPNDLEDFVVEFLLEQPGEDTKLSDLYKFIVDKVKGTNNVEELTLLYTDGSFTKYIYNEKDLEELIYTEAAWILDYFEFMNSTVAEVLDWNIAEEPIF